MLSHVWLWLWHVAYDKASCASRVWMSNQPERTSSYLWCPPRPPPEHIFPEPLIFLQHSPDLRLVPSGATAMHILNLIVTVTEAWADNIYRGSFCKLLVFTEINFISLSYFQTFKSANVNAPAFVQKYPQAAHTKTLLKHAQIYIYGYMSETQYEN